MKESTGLVYAKFKMKDVETNIKTFVQELITITPGILYTWSVCKTHGSLKINSLKYG